MASYRCPVCGGLSVELATCNLCGTQFDQFPCCVRKDGACGRIIETADGRTMRGHRYWLLRAREQWERREVTA